MVYLGAAYFNTGSPKWKSHLHMVVSDPTKNPNEVVFVNATTMHEDTFFDDSCLLDKGDHPDITHESYITYLRMAFPFPTAEALEKGFLGKVLKKREDLSPELLRKIQHGLMKSRQSRRRAKAILEEQGVVLDPEDLVAQ